jgi:hypothetical protein
LIRICRSIGQVGKKHDFSAGLIIGGKDFAAEQGLINNMNILICTPGVVSFTYILYLSQNQAYAQSILTAL